LIWVVTQNAAAWTVSSSATDPALLTYGNAGSGTAAAGHVVALVRFPGAGANDAGLVVTANCSVTSSTNGGTGYGVSYDVRVYATSPANCVLNHRYEPPTRMQELRWKRDRLRRGAAEVKAEALLRSLLDERQDRDLTEKGWFDVLVRGDEGERVYRIKRGRAGNVVRLGADGREVERLCVYPRGPLPAADSMAAQKLMLENDERKFRKVANKTLLR